MENGILTLGDRMSLRIVGEPMGIVLDEDWYRISIVFQLSCCLSSSLHLILPEFPPPHKCST